MTFKFVLDVDLGAAEYFRVDVNAADKYLGGCGFAAAADGEYMGITGGKKGASIELVADGTDGWNITGISGVWVAE